MGIPNALAQSKSFKVKINCPGCCFDKFPKQFSSQAALFKELELVKQYHLNKGFLAFSIDSVVFDTLSATIHGTKGNRYYIKKWECIPENYSHLLPELFFPKGYSNKLVYRTEEKLLSEIYSEGFANGTLEKKIDFDLNNLHITYKINSGEKFLFDTLTLLGNAKTSTNYVVHKTGVFPGKPYESKKIDEIKKILNQTGFLKVDTIQLHFNASKAKLAISIDEIGQNKFNGIVGIQTNSDNKTKFTGDIELQLVNALKGGEKIFLGWKKPADNSQELKLDIQYPYLLKSPIGIICSALLEKQDSTFSNTSIIGGLSIPSYNRGEFGVLVQWKNSSTNQSNLAEYGTSNSQLYGISYQFRNYNPYIMATKGIGIESKIVAGNKEISKTDEEDYRSFYSEFNETTEWLLPAPLGALYIKNQSGLLINDSLYRNNLLREGGIKSIRGFNEKSIYSKAYTYFTCSYRIIIKSNSYLEGFFDVGWFNEPTNKDYTVIARQALGVGTNISTKAGMLSIAFAIGKKGDKPFKVNEGQIHVGYTTLF